MEYELILPYPPSNNHYKGAYIARNKKIGKPAIRFFVKNGTESFKQRVISCFYEQHGKKITGKNIKVEIDIYPPDYRKRDIDNCIKVTLDALQDCGAFKDDFYIQFLKVERKEKKHGGELRVRISSIN